MGWTDDLKGNLGQTFDPGNLLGLGGTKHQNAGVGGVGGPDPGVVVAADGSQYNPNLVRQPDGTFINPTTGTRYSDPGGQAPIAAQNTAQQIAGATNNSQDFLNQNQVQQQRGGEAYAGQKAFGNDLNQVIRNPNAPTVSTSVMNQALGNIDRTQLAGVAGQGGANAGAARKQALMNMGNQDIQAAQGAAIARATEANGARQAQATNLQNMAGNSLEATGQNNQAAGAFANLGMQGAAANQQAQIDNNKINAGIDTGNMQQKQGFIGGVAGAGMKAFA